MPTIGGVNIGWDNTTPADTESAGLGDDRIRSLKTSLQQALNAEHNFPSGGGANTGYHVLGSARPFWGPQSTVSSSGTDGRLMLTSDTSRLFAVGSGGTVFLGGEGTVVVDGTNYIAWPQRSRWALERGSATLDPQEASGLITFSGSGFSGIPYTFVQSRITGPLQAINLVIQARTASTFSVLAFVSSGASATGGVQIDYISLGTRTL